MIEQAPQSGNEELLCELSISCHRIGSRSRHGGGRPTVFSQSAARTDESSTKHLLLENGSTDRRSEGIGAPA